MREKQERTVKTKEGNVELGGLRLQDELQESKTVKN